MSIRNDGFAPSDDYNQSMKAKAYILDGSGYLYRAYHGLPAMINSEGKPMQMVYGFCKMMLALLREQPDYFVIVRDTPSKTIRHDADVTYKANRVKMPDDFGDQIRVIHDLMNQIGLPQVSFPGYEADDVLYSFACNCDASIEYHIYTADKDIKQVLRPGVVIQDPMKREMRDHHRFVAEYGFEPSSMVDYLTLIGDVSDNIPGVAGIGPKIAQQLIREYHTIEYLYHNLDKIPLKTREKLIKSASIIPHTKKMIQLYEVPTLECGMSHYRYTLDYDQMKQLFLTQVRFPSMVKLVDELKGAITNGMQQGLF